MRDKPPADTAATGDYKKFKKIAMPKRETSGDQIANAKIHSKVI